MTMQVSGSLASLREPASCEEQGHELFFAIDAEHRIVAINESMLNCLGLHRDQALSRPLSTVFDQTALAAVGTRARAALQAGQRMSSRERFAPRPDSEPRCFEFTFLPLAGAGDVVLACTARETAVERSFEVELIEAASREQRRLDRDLHDTLGQELAHASMLLLSLEKRLAGDAPQHLPLSREIRAAVAQAGKSMRATVYGLAPADLAGNSLPGALAGLAARFARYDGIDIAFVGPESIATLSPGFAEHVYRFAQEAVSNILRHASARRVRIELRVEEPKLVLEISDDGVGLDLAAAQDAGGMGLRFMRIRAQCLGGSVEFSSPGTGTRVVLTVPLRAGSSAVSRLP